MRRSAPVRLPSFLALAFLIISLKPLAAAEPFYPLSDVHPGLHGIGRTVFTGDRIEEFQVEILGVLRNLAPKQSIILARLSGGPLAQTGIMQGMSGSPVYIDGKLLGAVALGFPFSKEPIAGIQPIEQMITDSSIGSTGVRPTSEPEGQASAIWRFYRHLPNYDALPVSDDQSSLDTLHHLQTPLSLSGFTAATLQTLAAQFRHLGFEPMAGVSAGTATAAPYVQSPAVSEPQPAASAVVPGSMISVGLLTGDMNITADGTVTYVDGNRLYAFGHRFLDTGSTDMPFAHSNVVALIPTLNSSFKLSAPGDWVGTILSDRASAISGEIGRPARTVPLTVSVHSAATGNHDYNFQVVNDRFLSPFIIQTALFSVLDATERTLGRGTLQLYGQVEWDAPVPPLQIRDTFISDSGLVQQVSTDAVVPLGFVLGAGFQAIHLKKVSFHLEASESKHQFHLAQAWTSAHDVHPGDSVEITALLDGENGVQVSRSATYKIPSGAPLGALNFTVSDGNTLNFPEFAGLSQSTLHTPEDLIRTINSFRDSDALYVRIWRQQPSFTVSGPLPSGELSDPPPSVALILSDPSNSATSNAALALTRGSQLTELTIPTRGYVVTGAKTLQVEVKD